MLFGTNPQFWIKYNMECGQKWKGMCVLSILAGKPTGKRLLGRLRRKYENNIRMDLKEIGINTRNWVHSAQDRDYWRALMKVALTSRFHMP